MSDNNHTNKTSRDFKGIWIPKEIWLSEELSLQEKIFLVEIDSLSQTPRGCFASNKYFAGFFGLTRQRASQVIGCLVRKNWITAKEVRKGKQVIERILRVSSKFDTLSRKGCEPCQINLPGCQEKVAESNTVNNTIKNICAFDDFWKLYPKKKNKKRSRQLWEKLNPDPDLFAEIITALENQKKQPQWEKDDGQYIPLPTTWLNGERWTDEIDNKITKSCNFCPNTENLKYKIVKDERVNFCPDCEKRVA